MDLIKQYKELHKTEYTYSATNLHKESISQFLQRKKCNSILDYGCGKAVQYHKENIHNTHFGGIMPSLYDPAIEEYSVLPKGKFDAIICTDVLEHIEEKDIQETIKEIYSKANKFVYLGICNSPANAILPDGRNAHVTQKPLSWWKEIIEPYATVFTLLFVYGESGKSKTFIEK